jgi:hypothetical protein
MIKAKIYHCVASIARYEPASGLIGQRQERNKICTEARYDDVETT